MSQLLLLPDAAPQLRRESLPLDAMGGFAEATPSAKLREPIGGLGLLHGRGRRHPIGPLRAGRRSPSMQGDRGADPRAQRPKPPHVEAQILDGAKPVRREMCGGLALAMHASRTASVASELRAIEAILKAGSTDGEVATVKPPRRA